jgi:hypothetical protein
VSDEDDPFLVAFRALWPEHTYQSKDEILAQWRDILRLNMSLPLGEQQLLFRELERLRQVLGDPLC